MRQVKVKSPGTCGEYIQGWYQGSPCLISSPIDRYTFVTVTEGDFRENGLKPKSQKMIKQFIEKKIISKAQLEKIHIKVKNDIPKGKGMASSTADLAGIATALSLYFDLDLTENDIGKLCATIEPSDNLMFKELNLFNHLSGRVLKKIGGEIHAKVLMIDFYGGIDTLSFNESQDDYSLADLEKFSEIIKLFEHGIKAKNLLKIGQACTMSACLNQQRLPKGHLNLMIQLMEECGGLGIMIGHSGTVIGVIYEEDHFQKQAFLAAIEGKITREDYEKIYDHHLIKGGVEIIYKGEKNGLY